MSTKSASRSSRRSEFAPLHHAAAINRFAAENGGERGGGAAVVSIDEPAWGRGQGLLGDHQQLSQASIGQRARDQEAACCDEACCGEGACPPLGGEATPVGLRGGRF